MQLRIRPRQFMFYKMSYIGDNQSRVGESDLRPADQSLGSQEQSNLLALTSEWGHSVFELNSSSGQVDNHQLMQPADTPYKKSNFERVSAGEMKHNTLDDSSGKAVDWHRNDIHITNSLSVPHLQLQEKMKVEQEEQCDDAYTEPKEKKLQEGNVMKEHQNVQNPQFSPTEKVVQHDQETDDQISERKLRCCRRGRLTEEEVLAKRSLQAAAQREVRRRRREKMSDEELQNQRAAIAASQREARKRQRERMTDEQLQVRLAINAIAQREIRKRKHKSMTEEELKSHRAREAARQKELRQRRRMELTEEQLKAVRAKEAAASAARRLRRLEKESAAVCLTGQQPDPSPS